MAKLDKLLTAINGNLEHRKTLEQQLALYQSGQLEMTQDELLALHAQLQEHKALVSNVRAGLGGMELHSSSMTVVNNQ